MNKPMEQCSQIDSYADWLIYFLWLFLVRESEIIGTKFCLKCHEKSYPWVCSPLLQARSKWCEQAEAGTLFPSAAGSSGHLKLSPRWLQIDLAMTHQDVNLYAFVWLSRGSVTDEKWLIHAGEPGWWSDRQRTISSLVACSSLNKAATGSIKPPNSLSG